MYCLRQKSDKVLQGCGARASTQYKVYQKKGYKTFSFVVQQQMFVSISIQFEGNLFRSYSVLVRQKSIFFVLVFVHDKAFFFVIVLIQFSKISLASWLGLCVTDVFYYGSVF